MLILKIIEYSGATSEYFGKALLRKWDLQDAIIGKGWGERQALQAEGTEYAKNSRWEVLKYWKKASRVAELESGEQGKQGQDGQKMRLES